MLASCSNENDCGFSACLFPFPEIGSGAYPMAPAGGGWQSESTFSFNMGTEFRDRALSQRCAIGKWGMCVLSRSSTAHVFAHVSLEIVQGRCTCPWICRTCSRQRRAYSERLDTGETLHRRAIRQGRGSLRRSRLESRSGIEISDNPPGIRDGAICR